MGLHIGGAKVADIHLGDVPIGAVYQGTRKIWARPSQGVRWELSYSMGEVAARNGIDLSKDRAWADITPPLFSQTYPDAHFRKYGDSRDFVATVIIYKGRNEEYRWEWATASYPNSAIGRKYGGLVISKRDPVPTSHDLHAQVDVWRAGIGDMPAGPRVPVEAVFELPGIASLKINHDGGGALTATSTGETVRVNSPLLPDEDPGKGAASRHVRVHLIVKAGRAYAAMAMPGQAAVVLGSVAVPELPREVAVQLDTPTSHRNDIFSNTLWISVASKRMSLATGRAALADTAEAGIVLP